MEERQLLVNLRLWSAGSYFMMIALESPTLAMNKWRP